MHNHNKCPLQSSYIGSHRQSYKKHRCHSSKQDCATRRAVNSSRHAFSFGQDRSKIAEIPSSIECHRHRDASNTGREPGRGTGKSAACDRHAQGRPNLEKCHSQLTQSACSRRDADKRASKGSPAVGTRPVFSSRPASEQFIQNVPQKAKSLRAEAFVIYSLPARHSHSKCFALGTQRQRLQITVNFNKTELQFQGYRRRRERFGGG